MENDVKWLWVLIVIVMVSILIQSYGNSLQTDRLDVIEKRLNCLETECSGVVYEMPGKPKECP